MSASGSRNSSTHASDSTEIFRDTSTATRPRPRPRLGFKKSRNGCFNCKRRKIKCQETCPHPCHNCTRSGQDCIYPSGEPSKDLSATRVVREVVHLSGTPTSFTGTDLRLFHHFLSNCYPHLPLGNEKVWVTDIAASAHMFDFLIHAILGLAASHLSLTSTSQLDTVSLSHRVVAVRGLQEAIAHPPRSKAECDAVIATTYALSLQSSIMGNSVEEFLTMLRGCNLVTQKDWIGNCGTSFSSLGNDQLVVASERLTSVPVLDERAVREGTESLEQLIPLCTEALPKKLLAAHLDLIYTCRRSSRDAYFKYWELGTLLSCLPQTEFKQLIDVTDPIMQILLAHYTAVVSLMYPVKAMEWNGRNMGKPNRAVLFRIERFLENIPAEYHHYLDWPLHLQASAAPRSNCQPSLNNLLPSTVSLIDPID